MTVTEKLILSAEIERRNNERFARIKADTVRVKVYKASGFESVWMAKILPHEIEKCRKRGLLINEASGWSKDDAIRNLNKSIKFANLTAILAR